MLDLVVGAPRHLDRRRDAGLVLDLADLGERPAHTDERPAVVVEPARRTGPVSRTGSTVTKTTAIRRRIAAGCSRTA